MYMYVSSNFIDRAISWATFSAFRLIKSSVPTPGCLYTYDCPLTSNLKDKLVIPSRISIKLVILFSSTLKNSEMLLSIWLLLFSK